MAQDVINEGRLTIVLDDPLHRIRFLRRRSRLYLKHLAFIYNCKSCSFQSKHLKSIRRHISGVHSVPLEQLRFIKLGAYVWSKACPSCPEFRCLTRHQWYCHVSSQHAVARCQLQGCSFARSCSLSHKLGNGANGTSSTGSAALGHSQNLLLRLHELAVHGKRRCKFCPKIKHLTSNIALERHVFANHREQVPVHRMWTCTFQECCHATLTRRSLRDHLRRVHKADRLSDDIKSVSKPMLSALQITTRRTFDCQFCPYRSNVIKSLEQHNALKHDSALLKCVRCNYKVPTYAKLQRHYTRHERIFRSKKNLTDSTTPPEGMNSKDEDSKECAIEPTSKREPPPVNDSSSQIVKVPNSQTSSATLADDECPLDLVTDPHRRRSNDSINVKKLCVTKEKRTTQMKKLSDDIRNLEHILALHRHALSNEPEFHNSCRPSVIMAAPQKQEQSSNSASMATVATMPIPTMQMVCMPISENTANCDSSSQYGPPVPVSLITRPAISVPAPAINTNSASYSGIAMQDAQRALVGSQLTLQQALPPSASLPYRTRRYKYTPRCATRPTSAYGDPRKRVFTGGDTSLAAVSSSYTENTACRYQAPFTWSSAFGSTEWRTVEPVRRVTFPSNASNIPQTIDIDERMLVDIQK